MPANADPFMDYVQELAQPDLKVRQNAIKALAALGDIRSVPVLIQLLDAKETPIRIEAVKALTKLRRPETIESLIHTLKTNRPSVQVKAAIALGQFSDPRVVPALIGALGDSDTKVNAVAAEVLGRLGHLRAVSVLIAIVEDPGRTAPKTEWRKWNGFGLARAAAITALGKLGEPRAIPALIQALPDDHKEVERAVLLTLAKFGEAAVPSLVESLDSADGRTRNAAVRTLDVMQCHSQVLSVIPLLKDPNNRVRRSAASYLGHCGDPQAVPALVESLDDTSTTGAGALLSLGESGREALKAVLTRQTGPLVRMLSGLWWSEGLDPRFVPPVIELLRGDDPALRKAATGALGRLKDERAVLPLIDALQDEDPLVRSQSADALGRLRDPRSIEPLIVAMHDPNERASTEAINALAMIGGDRVVEAFLQVLERVYVEGQPLATANCVGIIHRLGELGDKSGVELLLAIAERPENQAHKNGMCTLIQTLGKIGDNRATAFLIRLLENEDFDGAAAEALGSIGDRSAVEPIIKAMLRRTIYLDSMVRALGNLGDSRSIAPLTGILAKQISIDPMSMKAFGQVGAVSALIGYSKHPNEYIRVNAVEALSEITDSGEEREAVVQSLTEAMQDTKRVVRSAATRALRKMGVKINSPVHATTYEA